MKQVDVEKYSTRGRTLGLATISVAKIDGRTVHLYIENKVSGRGQSYVMSVEAWMGLTEEVTRS